MQPTVFENWYTTIQACSVLNRSDGWLRQNVEKRNIERKVIGKTALYKRADIDRVARELREQEAGV